MYHAARNDRMTGSWGAAQTSEDAQLHSSLRSLRGRSRTLVRDSAYAKRAKVVVINNVVGPGVGMQAQVRVERGTTAGQLNDRVNDEIEDVWRMWSRAENCHMGGALHFSDFERAAMGQVFETGEAFIRLHAVQQPGSPVALCLELIEAERIAEDYIVPEYRLENELRMGIEVDRYGKPIAYWIRDRHPSEVRYKVDQVDSVERVPADQIIHLRVIDRWPQTRGVPWLHAVARRLNDMDGYSEAEIVAARASASYMGFVVSPDGSTPMADGDVYAGEQRQLALEPGVIEALGPGEDIRFHDPSRPNTAIDPFLRYMLREVAAGVGVSYESLSRDYSQSNYSSSRLALLDDRDLWRVLQQWWIRSFREPLHRRWLESAVLYGALSSIQLSDYLGRREHFERVRFKPRGWSWVDPTKEVEAYRQAVLSGFTTVSDVIASTGEGRDLEDVLELRRAELDMMEEAGLSFDTKYQEPEPAPSAQPNPPPQEEQEDESDDESEDEPEDEGSAARVVSLR